MENGKWKSINQSLLHKLVLLCFPTRCNIVLITSAQGKDLTSGRVNLEGSGLTALAACIRLGGCVGCARKANHKRNGDR